MNIKENQDKEQTPRGTKPGGEVKTAETVEEDEEDDDEDATAEDRTKREASPTGRWPNASKQRKVGETKNKDK